jgi:hypothetical protein
VRTVEDGDAAKGGGVRVDAPEEVVGAFLRRRGLERDDAHPLRVDRGEDVLNRSVLAGCVEALQDDQNRMPVVGVKQLLLVKEFRAVCLDFLFGFVLRNVLALVSGVDLAQLEFAARLLRGSPYGSPSSLIPISRRRLANLNRAQGARKNARLSTGHGQSPTEPLRHPRLNCCCSRVFHERAAVVNCVRPLYDSAVTKTSWAYARFSKAPGQVDGWRFRYLRASCL